MVTRVPTRMITTTGVQAGSYTAADITVNEAGQITSAASNSVVVSGGGGGPKITGVAVTDNAWTALDDTAVDVLGGYIKITGTGFNTGCLVYFNQTPASSVSFISSTELRVTTGALTAGTYVVYAINTDGGVAISVPGVTFSASPGWQTASTLSDQYDGVAISLSLTASEATSYTLVSGSLPPGLSLNTSTGAITGTVVGVTVDTTYTFTVRATDAQNQDSPRTFTVTITVSDLYFNRTTLLLSGSALTTNTVLRDSSTNNFNLTAYGDTRASNFSPYGTGWSAYFDGTTDFVSTPTGQANLTLGTSDFTIEGWFYIGAQVQTNPALFTSDPGIGLANTIMIQFTSSTLNASLFVNNVHLTASSTNNYLVSNQWNHIAVCRTGGSTYSYYINGVAVDNVASNSTSLTTNSWRVGYWTVGANAFTGNISNFRIIKGTALYSGATITVPTAPLTAVANTQLLILQSNRFIDSSTNNFAITRNGDVAIRSFNPFGITNTGVNGSAYFDGTGDYLSAAYNSAFDLGSSNFTLEAWLYTSDSSSNYPSIVGRWQGSGTACWDLRPRSTDRGNFLVFVYSTDGGTTATFVDSNGPALSDNAWHHVVAVRSGNNFALFVDGTRRNTANLSGVTIFNSASAPLNVGYDPWGTTYFTGYLSNVRVVKGTAVYDPTQTTLTVPTAPLTNIANTQLLTLQYDQPHNNHTFLDSSSNQHLITRNGNATQGSFSPFSPAGWSVYFTDTSSHNISAVTGAETSPGTGDFCAELWYWTSKSGNQALIGNLESETETQWVLTLITGGVIRIQGWINTYVSGTSGPLNSWNHVAVCRSGTTMSIFVNGSRVGTATVTNNFSGTSNIRVGGPNGIDYFLGYISNARFVKGSSVYDPTQVSITVPTGPLTAITNTKFLVCQSNRLRDISSNNFTLTTSGSPQVRAFSPFAPTAVYSPATHGASAYFDGTGDWLSIVDNDQFYYPADFTLEAWCYSTSTTGSQTIVSQLATNNRGINLATGWVTANRLTFSYSTAGNNELLLTDTDNFPVNQWVHVTVSRTGTTISMFVNGSRKATGTVSGTLYNSTRTPTTIGGYSGNSGEDGTSPWNGYISGLRSTKGSSVYNATQTSITVPTAPLIATTNTNLLLNFTAAAILDSSGRQILETVGNAQISTTQSKFDGSSIYLDGNGDYLYSPANPLNILGTADFTIEMWAYVTDYTTASPTYNDYGTFIDYRTANVSQVNVLLTFFSNIGGLGRPVMYVNGAVTITGNVITTNTWTHIALCRASGVTRLFMNGNQAGSNYTDTNNYVSNLFTIGTNINRTEAFLKGYIQDPRITRGYARYTSNFTPPAVAHRLK